MNISYLKEYISRQLHTYVRHYDLTKKSKESFCARHNFTDRSIYTASVESFLCGLLNEELPILASLDRKFVYGIVSIHEAGYIVGPIHVPAALYLNNNMDQILYDEAWAITVPEIELGTFIDKLLLLHNLYHEAPATESDIVLHNCSSATTESDIKTHFSDILFQHHEYRETHNPYDQELREFSSIEHGNVEQLKRSWNEDYTGKLGILAKDELRNNKNLGIVLVTLASRAAMKGGVIPEIALSLSDSYYNKLEECKNSKEAFYIARQSECEYASMVHDVLEQKKDCTHRKDQNPRISRCKDYIFNHLHEKILIQDIADELYLNVNYLSMIFKEYEGISIGNYIVREKINLAKNLLIYSQYSYIEIASYLAFSSQSHLGKQFKRETGMTLRQYREKYGVQDFVKKTTELKK